MYEEAAGGEHGSVIASVHILPILFSFGELIFQRKNLNNDCCFSVEFIRSFFSIYMFTRWDNMWDNILLKYMTE